MLGPTHPSQVTGNLSSNLKTHVFPSDANTAFRAIHISHHMSSCCHLPLVRFAIFYIDAVKVDAFSIVIIGNHIGLHQVEKVCLAMLTVERLLSERMYIKRFEDG